MRSCMKQLVNRMLKISVGFVLGSSKSSTGTRPPHHSAARTDVVLLIRRTVRPRGYAAGFNSPAALLDEHFEHPVWGSSSCLRRVGHRIATMLIWFFCGLIGLITSFGFWGFGSVWADEGPLPGPRT